MKKLEICPNGKHKWKRLLEEEKLNRSYSYAKCMTCGVTCTESVYNRDKFKRNP